MINYSPNRVGIRNSTDYSPFGVELDGRTVSVDGYRFGFQNQEKDNEVKGEGNSINYSFRMHDPRLGRFFAVDPMTHAYPIYSPYQFSGNRVVDSKELNGLQPKRNIHYYNMIEQKDGTYKPIYHHSHSRLVTRTTNAIFINSVTKKESRIGEGNFDYQDNITNVYTYWNLDGTIKEQKVISKNMTKEHLPTWNEVYTNWPKEQENGEMKDLPNDEIFSSLFGSQFNPNNDIATFTDGSTSRFNNACATRLSISLIKSGENLKSDFYIQCGDLKGNGIIVSAVEMKNWLLTAYPDANYKKFNIGDGFNGTVTPEMMRNSLNGKTGIYIMIAKDCKYFGATGHCALWTGNQVMNHGDGSRGDYAESASEVYFWELK
jgi:RHS repeat-associated protein